MWCVDDVLCACRVCVDVWCSLWCVDVCVDVCIVCGVHAVCVCEKESAVYITGIMSTC